VLWADFLLSFVAIFVALDVVGTLPMYVTLTDGMTDFERRKVVNTSMLIAFLVAIAFMVGGEALFKHLGITLFDFQIAGGIVLLLISLADLVGNSEVKTRASGQTGIVPLAVPLITGPAVLTTLIFQISHSGWLITILALSTNYALAWLLLYRSETVTRLIGRDGTVVISKIAALLLAAIAVSMIRGGVFGSVANFRAS
jgi:multiple antibiotic resistance protein